MIFVIFSIILHSLPDSILIVLGQCSDIISDLSPQYLRGIEHILFTFLLN